MRRRDGRARLEFGVRHPTLEIAHGHSFSPRMRRFADKPATLFVGLELTKSTWLVAIYSPQHRLATRSSNVAQRIISP